MKDREASYVAVASQDGFSYSYVKVPAGRQSRYEIYRAKDGYRWRLRAANSQIVGIGEAHTRKADAIRACKRLTDIAIEAANSPLVVVP